MKEVCKLQQGNKYPERQYGGEGKFNASQRTNRSYSDSVVAKRSKLGNQHWNVGLSSNFDCKCKPAPQNPKTYHESTKC